MIDRWRLQPAAVQDLLLAVLLGAAWFGVAAYWEAHGWHPRNSDLWDLAGAGSVIVLALRRWAPAAVLAAVVLAYPVLYGGPQQSEFHLLPVLIAAYTAARRPPVDAVAVAVASLAAGLLLSTGTLHIANTVIPNRDWSRILFDEFAVAGMVLLGVLTAAQRRTAVVLAARNAELERLRAIEAEQAVALERTRIARELHDDVAHHLTALIVRAQAAERVAATRPEVAVESMGWFADTGRYALTALRRTVSVLRNSAGPAQLAPGPSLDDLPAIVARVQEAGLTVTLDVDGRLPSLEPQVQHAVVRVVQESLTNVLRHARARRAVVSLVPSAEGLTVVVEDDGRGPGPEAAPPGRLGLVGMRERAASCGGRLDIDRGPLGGWRVRAWFPGVVSAVGA
ncbi:MAG: sensor histidine kinase [Acidimicrobiia bacterium]|nr:sensor histidine kinase [Acidimicrobiia bacterium]